MFAFTKEQKQKKLANQFFSDYKKLSEHLQENYKTDLKREAISNAMADIVDAFTLLRTTYSLSTPVNALEDYRLLRVPGMPGIVLEYRGYASEYINVRYSHYSYDIALTDAKGVQPYLLNALLERKLTQMEANYKRKADKYGIELPFSEDNYDTILNLESATRQGYIPITVTINYNREICTQFAHTTNLDILISI